jgi:hypothetical protein
MKFVLLRSRLRRHRAHWPAAARRRRPSLRHLRDGVTTTMAGFWPGHASRANTLPWHAAHGDTEPRERPPGTLHEQPLPI